MELKLKRDSLKKENNKENQNITKKHQKILLVKINQLQILNLKMTHLKLAKSLTNNLSLPTKLKEKSRKTKELRNKKLQD